MWIGVHAVMDRMRLHGRISRRLHSDASWSSIRDLTPVTAGHSASAMYCMHCQDTALHANLASAIMRITIIAICTSSSMMRWNQNIIGCLYARIFGRLTSCWDPYSMFDRRTKKCINGCQPIAFSRTPTSELVPITLDSGPISSGSASSCVDELITVEDASSR